jgi:ferritin
MKSKLVEPFNAQIESEFAASAQYIAIATYFEEMGLLELANYFYRQSDEERTHAMKFVQFMLDTGVRPTIPGIPSLRNDFASPSDSDNFA